MKLRSLTQLNSHIAGACKMCASHNSADEGGDVVEVIWEALTDIMKELNGLRQVSHSVPDTHRTVNRLRQNPIRASFWKLLEESGSWISAVWSHGSNLVKTLPGGHFGVWEGHAAQKSLGHKHTHTALDAALKEQMARDAEKNFTEQSCYRDVTDVA